ncbi:hypothetical protein KKB18_03200 [bacterium]|nr:hypothetical protein [bacterium]
MKRSSYILCVVLLSAFFIILCLVFIPFKAGNAADSKEKGKEREKPAAFLDPIEDSVDLEDKKTIYKVLKGYKEAVEKDGMERVELPFSKMGKPDAGEEQDEDIAAKEETKTASEEYDKLEKPEFFLTIPTIAKETACVVKNNGQIQCNVFFTTYFDFECSNIQVWRLIFTTKEGSSEDKKEWQITDKKIKNILTNLNHINIKPDNIYSFDSFEFSHDRIKVKYGAGYFVTLFAGDITIGGILLGKGGFYYDPPRQLSIDDLDSEVETYQLMRFTGTKEDGVYKNGKTKLENEPFKDGFIMMHPDKFEEYIKLDQFKKVNDEKLNYSCLTKTKKILAELFPSRYKFPEVKDKELSLFLENGQVDYFFFAANTKLYDWLYYEVDPFGNENEGINNEVWLIQIKGGSVLGMYHTKEQRETMTKSQLEHESKERVYVTHETVECNVKENKTDEADVKSKLIIKIMTDNVEKWNFYLSNELNVLAIVDKEGFAQLYCQAGMSIFVFPTKKLKKNESAELTFYTSGKISYKMSSDTLHSDPSIISPYTGYLQCMTLDLLIKTPKPMISLSVGKLMYNWEEKDYNVAYWKSNDCIRFWSIIYDEYEKYQSELDLPEGKLPFYLYYKPTEWFVRMANKKRIIDETEGVMNWLKALYGKYPYPKISIAQKSIVSGYSQGFPSMLQISGFYFLSDMIIEAADLSRWTGGWSMIGPKMLAHEAGHQWWGNIVGWARTNDQWLSEGITEQQAPNYMQARDKNDVILKDTLHEWRENSIKSDKEGPVILGFERLGFEPYISLTYGKAPFVMNMLRMIVGEEVFVSICRQFIKVFGFKMGPTTSDFVEIVSRTLGEEYCTKRFAEKNMNWFFDQWIYNCGIPEFAFAYKTYEDGGKWKAKCRIKMLNGVLFKIPARVDVYDKKKKDPYFVEILLEPKEVQEVEIDLKGEPKQLFFNKFDTVLSKGTTYEEY